MSRQVETKYQRIESVTQSLELFVQKIKRSLAADAMLSLFDKGHLERHEMERRQQLAQQLLDAATVALAEDIVNGETVNGQ